MELNSSLSSLNSSTSSSEKSSSSCHNQECSELVLPPHWIHRHSRSREGKVYFANSKTKKVFWELPPFEPCKSSCYKCRKYAKQLRKNSDSNSKAKSSKNIAAIYSSENTNRKKMCSENLQSSKVANQNLYLPENSCSTNAKSSFLKFKDLNYSARSKISKQTTCGKHPEKNMRGISSKSSLQTHSYRPSYSKQSLKVNNSVKHPKLSWKQQCYNKPSSRNLKSSKILVHHSGFKTKSSMVRNKPKSNAYPVSKKTKSFININDKLFGKSLIRPICHSRRRAVRKHPFRQNSIDNELIQKRLVHSSLKNNQFNYASKIKQLKKMNLNKLIKRKKIKFDHQASVLSSDGTFDTLNKKCPEFAFRTPLNRNCTLPTTLEIYTIESMDIDCNTIENEDSESIVNLSSTEQISLTLWIIVDTNLLIHELPLVKSLSSRRALYKKYSKMMIVIPHTAIRELDLLKKDSKCQYKAQMAVKWINTVLMETVSKSNDENFVNGAHNICGQSLKNYNDLHKNEKDKNGDDRILDYCLWLKHRGYKVLLLSNDINFRNKAIFAKVPSVGSKSFKENLVWANELSKVNQSFQLECDTKTSSCPKLKVKINSPGFDEIEYFDVQMDEVLSNASSDYSKCEDLKPSEVTDRFSVPSSSNEISKLHSSVSPKSIHSALISSLSNILTARMKSVFGELWLSIVIRKPPWTLNDLFVCWEKHWLAVFIDIYPRELQENLKRFQQMSKLKSTEEELYEQLCKIYSSLSIGKFADLIVYPEKDSIEGTLNKSISHSLNKKLEPNPSDAASSVDQNSNVISSIGSQPLKRTFFPEISSSGLLKSSNLVNTYCTSTSDPPTHVFGGSGSQSFSDDNLMSLDVHGKTDESVTENSSFNRTECQNVNSVDARTLDAAHGAFIATGEKMRSLVHEGLSSLSGVANGSERVVVLESLQNLRSCIRGFRVALALCRENSSAPSHFQQLRSAILEFWANVHDHNKSIAAVFHSESGDVVASALFRSKEEVFWLTCLNHLCEMEAALGAELPEATQPLLTAA